MQILDAQGAPAGSWDGSVLAGDTLLSGWAQNGVPALYGVPQEDGSVLELEGPPVMPGDPLFVMALEEALERFGYSSE